MIQAKLKAFYSMELDEDLRKIYDQTYFEVLNFARHAFSEPNLEDLSPYPEFEKLADAYFLIKSGAIECDVTDAFPSGDDLTLTLKLNEA